tara:strand:+ start:7422 stop:8366 length:945 start_codon:yes stop_codon:yes gene_type:complete
MSKKITPLLLGIALVIFSVSQSVLVQVMASKKKSFTFHLSAVVHITECLKLAIAIISVIAYSHTNNVCDLRMKLVPSRQTILVMALPALLYTVSNTLTYHSIALMGSSNFQIWGNLRIVITAVLCRLLIPRPLIVIQWLAIILLVFGSMTCSIALSKNTDANFTISITSVLCILAQTTCTSLAGIYQEILLKSTDEYLITKSVCLYTWTCFFSGLKLQDDLQQSGDNIFIGFSRVTWLSVVVYACYGQVVSLTLAYGDNLLKVFATSFGATVALLVDALLLGHSVHFVQISGAIIVLISTALFYLDTESLSKFV